MKCTLLHRPQEYHHGLAADDLSTKEARTSTAMVFTPNPYPKPHPHGYLYQLSEAVPSEVGVRQGDILSPNLFNLFINDLPECLSDSADCPQLGNRSVKCLLYADDLVIFSHSLNGLQIQLDQLSAYCKNWGLEINLKKSKVMFISKKAQLVRKEDAPRIGSQSLEFVECYKYLGLVVYSNGKLLQTASNLCTRGWKAIFKLNLSLRGCDTKAQLRLKLFDTLVKPILCYGAEVWGGLINTNDDEATFWKKAETLPVEQFHLKIIKSSLMVHSKASNAACRGETGRYPILIHIVKLMLNYWKHMEKNKHDNPLLHEAMLCELENSNNKGSWFYTVNAVMKLFCGTHPSSAPDSRQINRVIYNMKSSYERFWKSQLGDPYNPTGKLSLYRKIKPAFRMEKYLDDIPKHIHRRALTALRISAHKLEIEVGRYSRDYTPRQNRFCTLCNNAGSAQTGDEFHAIMHCPSFAAQRENLRDKVAGDAPLFNKLNEYEQFIFLLTCEGAPACHMGEFSYNVLSAVRKPVWGLNLINTCLSVYDVYIAICWFSLSFCCYVS